MPLQTNIGGTRWLGACDYCKLGEEGQDAYVRSRFVHCYFMPAVAKESFLFAADGRAIKLPAVVGRSVVWARLRYIAWICAISTLLGVVVGILPIEVRRQGPVTTSWWPWALSALSAVLLGLAIFVTVYKPKASKESQQRYQRYLDGELPAPQDRGEQMAAAAEVHGGPADEIITIEPLMSSPGTRRANVKVPMAGRPTKRPTTRWELMIS
ncbi:uncharacterized protein [Branchiostoma lanceolatum]|uniref:Hypp7187 protein n=1 Tax=Branchiostoma lanceolatum TaxID=7740 RepID=A0A8J9YYJ8_BRALA|nr:Hypp7187 [Branchiostoma lanceolatum]